MFRLVSKPDVVYDIVKDIVNEVEEKQFVNWGGAKTEFTLANGGTEITLANSNNTVDMRYVDDVLDKNDWQFGTWCFNTDIPYFDFDGICFLYGHGDICDAHCPREYISIADLKTCVKRYTQMAVDVMKLPKNTGYAWKKKLVNAEEAGVRESEIKKRGEATM